MQIKELSHFRGTFYTNLGRASDKLPSYTAALRDLSCDTPHVTKQYQNNIAEISHQKTHQQQRQMRQFKSIAQAQRFLACHGVINNHFRQQRVIYLKKNIIVYLEIGHLIYGHRLPASKI